MRLWSRRATLAAMSNDTDADLKAFADEMERLREAHMENPSEEWRPELPVPARPKGVPADASWDAERGSWSAGERTAAGARTGRSSAT